MNGFDWNQARAFHATVETGSLSGAARRLSLTQPTISRQVAALEASLGVTLFQRVGKTLVPTETGLDLFDHVRAMGEAAGAMALAATGRASAVEGLVRVSATDIVSVFVLPPILARIRAAAPQITVELVSSNALSDLRRREADIAIRHVEPDQPDLIARKVRQSRGHLYASEAWVARNGMPRTPADLANADIVGFDNTERLIAYFRGWGVPAEAANVRLMSENAVAVWEMVRLGLGIGVMEAEIAERTPGMVALLPDMIGEPVPFWLVSHRELRTSRRIRLVYDMLAEALAAPAGHFGRDHAMDDVAS
ncbi:MAG: LysR family transcriptional regulator [Roseitalea sp.]|jgi:DNA-binding transcriptional LysR family regulator|nr:LysR family transcriptional regulator [Roseitalea sp.]MBO6722256.1 LysR family transcriptional regulator [Roseitalea sp.]MBO6742415.1 LysR family transcriptional regulator [Roseitalea sp.]